MLYRLRQLHNQSNQFIQEWRLVMSWCGSTNGVAECVCDWCGRRYHFNSLMPSGYQSTHFCSKKCEIEATGAGQCSGNCQPEIERRSSVSRTSSPSSSSSSSSASEGGPIQAILGLIILIAICWGGWKICKGCYNWLFGSREVVVTEAMMMDAWQEHIEQRCEAFSDGLSEKEVEAKGLKNYSWEEWQNRQVVKQTTSPEKTNAEVIGDKAKALWQNITSQEKKDPEEELKKLNARLAELEGDRKPIAVQASNSTSCDVQFSGDERIVTVTSEYGSRTSAWQAAVRSAVESAVINFVSDSRLLTANHTKLKERLDTVDKTDIKKLDILSDQQVGEVFTVKIRAAFDKKSLAPKFKDIFPVDFGGGEAHAPVVTQSAPNTSAVPSRRTSQQSATPVVTQSAPKTSVTPSTRTNPQPVKPVTPKVSSPAPAPAPAMRTTKPKPTPVKPASVAVNSEQKTAENKPAQPAPSKSQPAENKPTQSVVNNPRPVMPRPVQPQAVQRPVVQRPVVQSQPVSGGRVWVPGDYVDEVHANGSVVRVWKPGHYETGNTTQPRSPNPAQLKFQQQLDKKIQRKLRKL